MNPQVRIAIEQAAVDTVRANLVLTQAQEATCTTSNSAPQKSDLVVPHVSNRLVVGKNTHLFCVLYRRDPFSLLATPLGFVQSRLATVSGSRP